MVSAKEPDTTEVLNQDGEKIEKMTADENLQKASYYYA